MTTITKRDRTSLYKADRTELAAGLRALADLIETNPAVPIPTSGLKPVLFVHGHGDLSGKDATRALLRTIGGHWDKQPVSNYMTFEGWLHGLPVDVWVTREAVCERVVTGTREVTETVPVGEDTRPLKTVTRNEDVVEWICSPLLADDTAVVIEP